jgi:hypothetical protein
MPIKTKKSEASKTIKAIIYGVQGVGKSTFMAHAPKPVFLDFEESTNDLDTRVDLLDPAPKTWAQTLQALGELATEPHDFLTLCIDSADWLEQLCIDYIVHKHKAKSFTDPAHFGYGKGFQILFEEWRNLLIALQKVSLRGMHVLLSAHSSIKPYNDPMGASFDRYSMKLTSNKQCDLAGYTQEWAQCVLFAHYDTIVGKIDERNVGLRGTTRVLHCNRTDAYDAKNRYGLPDKMPLDWSTFFDNVKLGIPEQPEAIVARIKEFGALPEKVQQSLERNLNNPRQLSQLENWLKTQQPKEKEIENAT